MSGTTRIDCVTLEAMKRAGVCERTMNTKALGAHVDCRNWTRGSPVAKHYIPRICFVESSIHATV